MPRRSDRDINIVFSAIQGIDSFGSVYSFHCPFNWEVVVSCRTDEHRLWCHGGDIIVVVGPIGETARHNLFAILRLSRFHVRFQRHHEGARHGCCKARFTHHQQASLRSPARITG